MKSKVVVMSVLPIPENPLANLSDILGRDPGLRESSYELPVMPELKDMVVLLMQAQALPPPFLGDIIAYQIHLSLLGRGSSW